MEIGPRMGLKIEIKKLGRTDLEAKARALRLKFPIYDKYFELE